MVPFYFLGYNPYNGLELLKTERISKAQARQRAGRAGRECPGVCYRLYTEQLFKSLEESSVPEIQRSNLASVILNLLAMGMSDISKFDFMDPPSEDSIQNALQELWLLGAIESVESEKVSCLSSFELFSKGKSRLISYTWSCRKRLPFRIGINVVLNNCLSSL